MYQQEGNELNTYNKQMIQKWYEAKEHDNNIETGLSNFHKIIFYKTKINAL